MSTVTCVKAGTCQGTPGLVCWDLFPHLELPSGVSRMAQNGYRTLAPPDISPH